MRPVECYRALGLRPGATADEIKQAYRKLAMKHHPDRGGDEAEFKKVKQAYEQLINTPADSVASYDGFENMHDMFDQARRSGGRNWSFDSGWDTELRNPDISVGVACSLEQAHTGFSRLVEFKLPSGQIRQVSVAFPPGTTKDIKIRYAGEGGTLMPNNAPGDLYVKANISAHPVWRVEGSDLFAQLEITVWQAMLGTTVEFDDIGGTAMQITVPAGTQSRSQLRLRNKGMNIRGSTQRGNAFLEVVVRIPALTDVDLSKTIIDLQHKV